MARFVVDCGVVLRLASEGTDIPAEHKLLAPTLLRSQTLSALHEAVHAGEIEPDVARERLARVRAMKIRLLGDAVLQRRGLGRRRPAGMGRDLWRRVHRAHSAAGRCVRNPRRGAGAPGGGNCPYGDDRSAANRLTRPSYTGRLTAVRPEAVRLLVFKADGSVLVTTTAMATSPCTGSCRSSVRCDLSPAAVESVECNRLVGVGRHCCTHRCCLCNVMLLIGIQHWVGSCTA